MSLGMFDPPEIVPYSKIDESELNSPAHRALAHDIANESMVLLKNDGVLPLKTIGIKIAVIGPLADQTKVLLGNYNGIPDAHGLDSRRTAEGILRRHHHLCFRHAVSGPRCRRRYPPRLSPWMASPASRSVSPSST